MKTRSETNKKSTFTATKNRLFVSLVLVLITSVVMIPGMATYLPFHQNDAVGGPILFFPIIWTGLFLYSYLDNNIKRVWIMLIALTAIHAFCAYNAITN